MFRESGKPAGRALAAMLVVGAAAACGDDGTQPPPPQGDGLAFNYSGDRSGTFSAEGDPVFAGDEIVPGTWAAAVSTDTGFILVGSRARALPLVDLFFLSVSDAAVNDTVDFGGAVGGVGLVAFDFDASVPLDVDSILDAIDESKVYGLTEGTLALTTLTSSRAAGTMAGSGPRFDGGPRLFVTSGTFDVPLVDASVVASAVPALLGLAPAPTLRKAR